MGVVCFASRQNKATNQCCPRALVRREKVLQAPRILGLLCYTVAQNANEGLRGALSGLDLKEMGVVGQVWEQAGAFGTRGTERVRTMTMESSMEHLDDQASEISKMQEEYKYKDDYTPSSTNSISVSLLSGVS